LGAPSIVFGFLARTFASILFVAVLLLLAAPVGKALVTTVASLSRWPEVHDHLKKVANEVGTQADAADVRLDQLRNRPVREIKSRLETINVELAKLSLAPRLASTSYLDLAQTLAQGHLEAALKAEISRRVLLQEQSALRFLELHAQVIAGPQAAAAQVRHLDELRTSAKQREVAAEAKVNELESQRWCRLPGTDCASQLSEARRKWIDANLEAWRTYREWEAAKSMLLRTAPIEPAPSFRTDRASVQAILDDMSREVARMGSWHITAAQPVWNAFSGAVQIVAIALAFGVGMKAFFYFGHARLAERRPPLFVQEGPSRATACKPSSSTLSLQVSLLPDQELVAIGSHLQSVANGARTRTRWLLSASHPLTSLFSGLWMLTWLRAQLPCAIVLSATTDALEELNTVTLAEGDDLVLLPKHLVGVIHPAGRHVRLRGIWKGGIHAWLTLQFRYLVFEGPCTLIVGGCRGVRVESADSGRSVSQAMTVGFSSHLAYSVARTETFAAYLLGQRPLFNDRFQGAGVVLYQEVPSTAQRAGFTGRGLQGVVDGAMKSFGL
jgi:hypothetical protein